MTATVTAVHDTYDEEDESILVIGTHNNLEVGRQRITITDDDELALTVELSDAVIAEAGGTSTVTVKTDDVTFADDQPITLVLGGTATETDDYTVTKELTLDAGESSVTTTVTAVHDTYDDDGETIEIKARHGAVTSAAKTVTITDDETYELTVELSAEEILEAGGQSTVTVKTGGVTYTDEQTITLELGGTATETDDYTVSAKTLTLGAGDDSVTATVTAEQDTYDDDAETIEIKARHGAVTSAAKTVTITDDETYELTVELSAEEILEAGGQSTVTVKTGGVTYTDEQTITLELGGTATETDDYTVSAKTLTLGAGDDSVTATVTAEQDTYDDDAETIEIKARHGAVTSAAKTVTITDDDTYGLTVELSAAAIEEAGGQSTVTVKTGGVTYTDAQTITLELGGTATETDDYTVSAKTLTLGAGDDSVTATVTAEQDTHDDDAETIEIKARHGAVTSAAKTVTITDDDTYGLTVELSAAAIDEAGGQSTVTVKTGGVTYVDEQTITLELGGTATETDDYTVSSKTLTLGAGDDSVTATVTAEQDTYDDDAETIEIKARHGAVTSAAKTVTITDDETYELTVELSAEEILEAGGQSTVTVKTGGVTYTDEQTITLELGGTATETDDYTVSAKTLTLGAGDDSVTATVTAEQDTYDDDAETIEIKARHGAVTSAAKTVTITDDETYGLTVELSAAAIDEAGGQSTVTVKTGGVTYTDEQTITLELGGTATETDDYTVSAKTLTLGAGDDSVTATVTAEQDTYDDDAETIEIKARHGAVTSAAKTVTITDDDTYGLTVELSAEEILEAGGQSTVTVKTNGVTYADEQTITLELGGTATETDDYTVSAKTLTLGAGDDSTTATVTAEQDTHDDNAETIEIKARHGAVTSAAKTVTITDDDTYGLTVELSAAAIDEAGGQSTVTVKTGGVTYTDAQTITLELGGTATETDDYTVSAKTLTLGAGDDSVTATVTAEQDTYDDDAETIEIKARHGAVTSAAKTVTITDDETYELTGGAEC